MRARNFIIAALLMAMPPFAFGQESTGPADLPVVVTGEVVRYEPGKVLVLRSQGKELSYAITANLAVPADVQAGKTVSVLTEADKGGAMVVTQVATTGGASEAQGKRTSDEAAAKPTGETATATMTVQGSVESYMPGKSITLLRSDGSTKTFTIVQGAKLPADISTGKTVTLLAHGDGSVETISIDKE